MDLLTGLWSDLDRFVPLLGTVFGVFLSLSIINRLLTRRWKDRPEAQFQFQLIMMLLTFIGILAIIVALPIDKELQSQLLRLIGLLLSAAIALSSTTFIGNIMAGIMMKVIRSARPGDWIQVGDITGRVTEMDLLHTEVQTEFRDLVTVPNLTMVTQPLHVVRASGTIITAEVSLGYDVPHQKIRQALCAAAEKAGLSGAFAQVRQLGDFSVSYRVGGLLEDVQSLISARSALRVEILDGLHAAGIEIVSPTFMNTLQRSPGESVIPIVAPTSPRDESQASESLAFDKAEAAANIEALRKEILDLTATIEAALNNDELDDEEIEELQFRKERLIVELADLENQHKQNED